MRITVPNMAMSIAIQARKVPFMLGDPGSGKTASLRSLASQMGVRFQQTILRTKTPEDIGGIPVTGKVGMTDGREFEGVRYLLPEEILHAVHEPTLWVFDEFNQAGHDTMGAAQEMLNTPLENSWMVCLGNPPERSTDGKELPPPVINRLCVLDWERPVDSLKAGWRNGFKNYPEVQFPMLPENWFDDYCPAYGNLFADMMDCLPHLFGPEAYPKDMDMTTKPYPSDRSMENAGVLLAACDSVMAPHRVRAQLVGGCIGKGAANEVLQYIGYLDLPDPEEMLSRPDLVEVPVRFDLARAMIASVIRAIEAEPTGERWERAYDILETVFQSAAEVAMSAEGALWKAKPAGYSPRVRSVGAAAEMQQARLASVRG